MENFRVFFSLFVDAVADGIGFVVAGLVGAMVALTLSLPGDFPQWWYLLTFAIAIMGALGVAWLRFLRRSILDPSSEWVLEIRKSQLQSEAAMVSEASDVLAEVRALRREIESMRRPWWRRCRRLGVGGRGLPVDVPAAKGTRADED